MTHILYSSVDPIDPMTNLTHVNVYFWNKTQQRYSKGYSYLVHNDCVGELINPNIEHYLMQYATNSKKDRITFIQIQQQDIPPQPNIHYKQLIPIAQHGIVKDYSLEQARYYATSEQVATVAPFETANIRYYGKSLMALKEFYHYATTIAVTQS